jgi:hypothetical protein
VASTERFTFLLVIVVLLRSGSGSGTDLPCRLLHHLVLILFDRSWDLTGYSLGWCCHVLTPVCGV